MSNVIGLDIGGTNLRIGLMRDNLLERGEIFPSAEVLGAGDEITHLGALIEDFRGETPISAVSIGFPSSISADGKTVLNAANLVKADGERAFSGKNLVDPLSKMLGAAVSLERDANCLLYHDMHAPIANGEKMADADGIRAEGIFAGCYIGTGFGAAAMINGAFLKGKHGSAMEAGHIPFYRSTSPCGCGKVGCAECYASGRAAKAMLDTHYPGLSFETVFRDHADDEPVSALVEAIAVTAATLVNIFDPHTLFLGGGVLSAEFPKEKLRAGIKRHALSPYPRDDLDIRFSRQDAFAGVIGAALYAGRMLTKTTTRL